MTTSTDHRSAPIAVGIALPGHLREFDAGLVPEWARAIESAGFDTLSVSDRLAWPTPEPVTTLAAAAAVTHRVGLLSSVLLGPPRPHPGLFASAAATVDAIAGPGRLRLGLAPGGRPSDHAGSPVPFEGRGKVFDDWLAEVRSTWCGESSTGIGPLPATPSGPPMLFGGASAPTVRRITEYGQGWIAGGQSAEQFATFAARVREAWTGAGRPGTPQLSVSVMVALGPRGDGVGTEAVSTYYADLGERFRADAVAATITDADTLRRTVRAFARAGADEACSRPTTPNPTRSIVSPRHSAPSVDPTGPGDRAPNPQPDRSASGTGRLVQSSVPTQTCTRRPTTAASAASGARCTA